MVINKLPQHSNRIYFIVFAIWLVLVAILAYVIIQSNLYSARQSFNHTAQHLYLQISDQIKVNETVVEGFAAMVDAMGMQDRRKIRLYARQMLERYPHIFMFEMVEKVKAKDREAFERLYRKTVYPGFKIKTFGYESDRKWRSAQAKSFYLPITFMEPFLPDSKDVLGLDLNSNQFFLDSLKKSARLHIPVVTEPFELVEGELAYLIHRPIVNTHDHNHDNTGHHEIDDQYVLLVILAKSLFKDNLDEMSGYDISLFHNEFTSTDARGVLYSQTAEVLSALERFIFPRLNFSSALDSQTQPFMLSVDKQLGWEILNWKLLITLACLGAISFMIVLKYAKVYHASELSRIEHTDHLFYMANHDSLTGLANRNLLKDRLEHAISQASRNETKLAILFMDLDNFKRVNDTHGHEVGDKLLRRTSERLLAGIRSGDTLARRSGDEFIVILENIETEHKVALVADKIRQSFEQGFNIDSVQLKIQISIGTAIYPDEAKTGEALLSLADKKMYEDKSK